MPLYAIITSKWCLEAGHMQGKKVTQTKVWYNFSLDGAVPANDFYRKLEAAVDLSWVRAYVADRYSDIGRSSIDPVVIVKIELVGYLENVTYERKIMREIADRLSLRRYIGYDIDEPVPDHSTLSRARDLLGEELFREVFEQSVLLCRQAGMVGDRHSSVDRTLMKADASMSSLEQRLVEMTPKEFVDRVTAQNPVEGPTPDNVVDMRDHREQLPQIGVVPEQDRSATQPETDTEAGENVERPHREAGDPAKVGNSEVERAGGAVATAAVEPIVPGPTEGVEAAATKADCGEDVSAANQTQATTSPSAPVDGDVDVPNALPASSSAGDGAVEPLPTRVSVRALPPIKVDLATLARMKRDENYANDIIRARPSRTDPDGPSASTLPPIDADGDCHGARNGAVAPDSSQGGDSDVAPSETGPGMQDPAAKPAPPTPAAKKEYTPPNNFTHVSRTDPDARIASKPGVLPTLAYSVEYWTDSRRGVITHADAFDATVPEHATVIAGVAYQRSKLGLFMPSLSGDKGYGKGRLYRQLNAAHVVGYIPFQKRGNKALSEGRYGIDKFRYDESRDVFECPGGHVLHYVGISVAWPSASHVWAARKQDCRQCSHREKCTKDAGGRSLSVNIYQTEYDEMAERLQGQGSRLAAIARRTGPEPRFGEGKRWTCLERAKFRGLGKVGTQALLVATAENLKKYVNWTWRKGRGAGAKKDEGQQVAETAVGAKLSLFFAPLQAPTPS